MTLSVGVHDFADAGLSFYSIWSHQRKFVALAARCHRARMTSIIDARLTTADAEETRRALGQQIVEAEQDMVDWHVEASAVFEAFPIAHLITYEPSLRRVQIAVSNPLSADPSKYDGKVTTTSEALAYACSLAGRPVANMGDLRWYSGNRALVKLACHILDRRELDLTRFRVAMDDPETWDFRYSEVEGEISDLS